MLQIIMSCILRPSCQITLWCPSSKGHACALNGAVWKISQSPTPRWYFTIMSQWHFGSILQIWGKKMFLSASVSLFVLLTCPGTSGNTKSISYLNRFIRYQEFAITILSVNVWYMSACETTNYKTYSSLIMIIILHFVTKWCDSLTVHHSNQAFLSCVQHGMADSDEGRNFMDLNFP